MSNIDNVYFDTNSLKVEFNKKISLENLFFDIKKKFSVNEIIKYAFVSYYKSKRNCVLITFTNEKIFIVSNSKKELPMNGIYSYQEIQDFEYIKVKNDLGKVVLKMESNYILKHVSKTTYEELINVFDREKTIFVNSKIGQNIRQSATMFNSLNFIKRDNEMLNENIVNNNQNNNSIITDVAINNKKGKRVVNDELISKNTSLSSQYLVNLLQDENELLPNKKKTILKNISSRVEKLEESNFLDKPFDTISLKFSSNSKLNTIPVLAEFSSLTNSNNVENRLLFSRNWIEFTKHNVRNKILGVDSNGNGAYFDNPGISFSKIIDQYKAKEYTVDKKIRNGLRSSQKIYFKDNHEKHGIESLYTNINTNEKLDLNKYDGIIFKNQKYYFNVPNEFNSLQRKYCKIQVQEYESDYKSIKLFELIFDDNTVSYNVYDLNKGMIDDSVSYSSLYDLKHLTFFKD